MENKELLKEAIEARKMAYAPYSRFKVGAALLTAEGKVYRGCNIENASYSPANCAERTAFFKAVSEGERNFTAIAIAGGPEDGELQCCAPCGVCRQVMMEFCDYDHFEIILGKSPEELQVFTLRELLPMGFGPGNLTGNPVR
jgi:cytidine deaminase